MENIDKNFKELQVMLKENGFIYQGSEIYGGLANTWDYGPLGTMITRNIRNAWWREFIESEPNNYGLEAKIILNPQVWVASGHVQNFSDPLIENKLNNKRYRADHVMSQAAPEVDTSKMTHKQIEDYLKKNVSIFDGEKVAWGPIRSFNLMFETNQGVVQDTKSVVYLRPELAQSIFINFLNIQKSMNAKIPFGIGQVGRSFRNEVTPGNYIFRTREFEQMELEYFVKPGTDIEAFNYYVEKSRSFILGLGIRGESVRMHKHPQSDLAHYSKATTDIEFMYPFGWGELLGVANRGDFDLKAHSKLSGQKLIYNDQAQNEQYTPYVIEPSIGVDRLLLALLVDAYTVVEEGAEKRIFLKLDPKIAPYKFAVMPLSKKVHGEVARGVYKKLRAEGISVTYDEDDSIGKRYRHQDLIGTPYVITITDDTARSNKATLRYRDSMKQIDISLNDLGNLLNKV